MSEKAATVAWLAFVLELDHATQVVGERFDAMLAEGVLPGEAKKHTPGGVAHDQKLHGRRGGVGRQEAVETGIMNKGDKVYRLHRSYGNINGAKAYIKRTTEKNPDLELEYFRHEGKYYVGELTAVRPPPKKPPLPEHPKVPKGDPEYSRTGIPRPEFVHHDQLYGGGLTDKELSQIRPSKVTIEGVAGNIQGDGTPAQKLHTSKLIGQLPLEHQVHVFGINVANDSGLGEYSGSSQNTVGYAEAKSITIAGKRGYLARSKTTIHEAGHAVLGLHSGTTWSLPASGDFDLRRRNAKRDLGELIRKRHRVAGIKPVTTGRYLPDRQARKIKGVSHYARGSVGEFIAESYAYYVTKPSQLRRSDPEAYSIMKEFFQDQEYPDLSAR